jgi:cytochrome c-type biogenesis protein CcmH
VKRAVAGWPGWLLLAATALALLIVGYQRAAQPLNADQRVQAIAERLACPVCDGESVAESRSPAARTIRDDIVKYVNAGQLTDDQIVNKIDDASVKDLRLTPRNSGLDLLVWFLPALMLTAAVAGLVVAFRQWRRPVGASGPSDDDRRLVAAALRQAEGEVIP